MDKDFKKLIEKAKQLAEKKQLTRYATCGHVGCALLTRGVTFIQEYQ